MRFVLAVAIILAVSSADAAEKVPVGKSVTTSTQTALPKKKIIPGATDARGAVSSVAELSDSDCINLQCELRVMTSCKTHVGCNCKGTGVTVCVDTIDPE